MSLFSFQIDPHSVLGIAHDASLHEIREAYRLKSKKHHPDVGGEEWAFRVLVQAYESLSKARVVQAAHAETGAGVGAGARRPQPRWGTKASDEAVRPGADDKDVDPAKVVDVEKLWIRYEVEHAWILQEAAGPHDDRFLSCSLNLAWPAAALAGQAASIPHAAATLRALAEVFDELSPRSGAIAAQRKVEDDKFEGWLSYSNVDGAWEAFKQLRDALHARGLGVKQWTRDLIIPRGWR